MPRASNRRTENAPRADLPRLRLMQRPFHPLVVSPAVIPDFQFVDSEWVSVTGGVGRHGRERAA